MQADERNKLAIFRNYAPFSNCITGTNNTETDKIKDIDVLMSMYSLIE